MSEIEQGDRVIVHKPSYQDQFGRPGTILWNPEMDCFDGVETIAKEKLGSCWLIEATNKDWLFHEDWLEKVGEKMEEKAREKVIVNDLILKRLDLCGMPFWAGKEVDMSTFLLCRKERSLHVQILQDLGEFLDALDTKVPHLRGRFHDSAYDVEPASLREYAWAYVRAGRYQPMPFFEKLANVIKTEPEAWKLFQLPPPPDFRVNDVVRAKANGNLYIVDDVLQDGWFIRVKPIGRGTMGGYSFKHFELVAREGKEARKR